MRSDRAQDRAQWAALDALDDTDATWWHGGVPGLQPGQLLLPRAMLALWNQPGARSWVQHPRVHPGQPDPAGTVSITTDPWAALAFADDHREPWPAMQKALRSPGTLYRVASLVAVDHTLPLLEADAASQAAAAQPAHRLLQDDALSPGLAHLDPDFAEHPTQFVRVARAVVLEVVQDNVELSERDFVRHLGGYQQWGPSEPVYDREGYLRPSPSMRAAGCTGGELREHGAWVPLSSVHHFGSPMRARGDWSPALERARAARPRRESLQLASTPLGRFAAPTIAGMPSGTQADLDGSMDGVIGSDAPVAGGRRRRWLRRR